MLPEERHERIRMLLASFHHLSTERIAAELGVSRETVRRDILKLEGQGQLRRVFGGVASLNDAAEDPIEKRVQVRMREKRRIARAAATLLVPGKTLFVDAGSTVSAFAQELSRLSGLTLITNSMDVALRADARVQHGSVGHEIIMLGGRPNSDLQATFGDITVGQIYRYRVDYAFLSPVGIHPDYGASSYHRAEAEVARAMCQQAHQVIILADHSKLGQNSRVQFCASTEVDVLITDAKSKKHTALAGLHKAGCQVIQA